MVRKVGKPRTCFTSAYNPCVHISKDCTKEGLLKLCYLPIYKQIFTFTYKATALQYHLLARTLARLLSNLYTIYECPNGISSAIIGIH